MNSLLNIALDRWQVRTLDDEAFHGMSTNLLICLY